MLTPCFRRADEALASRPHHQALSGTGKRDHGRARRERAALVVSGAVSINGRRNTRSSWTRRFRKTAKEIEVARSYGDLRGIFKAAKRNAGRAYAPEIRIGGRSSTTRGDSLRKSDTSQVSIGTIVTFCATPFPARRRCTVPRGMGRRPGSRHHLPIRPRYWPGVAWIHKPGRGS